MMLFLGMFSVNPHVALWAGGLMNPSYRRGTTKTIYLTQEVTESTYRLANRSQRTGLLSQCHPHTPSISWNVWSKHYRFLLPTPILAPSNPWAAWQVAFYKLSLTIQMNTRVGEHCLYWAAFCSCCWPQLWGWDDSGDSKQKTLHTL
jgi:hypothetical protein